MVGDAGVEPRDVSGAVHHVAVCYHGLVVDEEGKYVLENFAQVKKNNKVIKTDHATTILHLNITLSKIRKECKEVFNFKDKSGKLKFKETTDKTSILSDCLNDDSTALKQT